MYCDKAILYKDQNFIEAFNNVKMNQGDSIHMNSKYIEYSGKTQLAIAKGESDFERTSISLDYRYPLF